THLGAIFHHRDAVHRLRYRDYLLVPLRGGIRSAGLVWSHRDGLVRGDGLHRVRLCVASRRSGMGLEEKLPSGILLSTVEGLAGYFRKASFWPATFGLACCAIEMMTF